MVVDGLVASFAPLEAPDDQPAKAMPFAGHEGELTRVAEEVLTTTEQPSWRSAPLHRRGWAPVSMRLPFRFARDRRSYAVEKLGYRMYASAKIAPTEGLSRSLHELGGSLVTAARCATDSDRLLREQDRKLFAKQLAAYRESAHVSTRHVRVADALARAIATLDGLTEARREFDRTTKAVEPELEVLRERIFDARLDSDAPDEIQGDFEAVAEAVRATFTTLHDAYAGAVAATRAAPVVRKG